MPPWLTELLKGLGFTTPFIYAAATYGFFHYLDKRASGRAKQTISKWLDGFSYDTRSVSYALINVFERVYGGESLLTLRALLRSILFTVLITAVFFFEAGILAKIVRRSVETWYGSVFFVLLLTNCLADFAALFVIRRVLVIGGTKPVISLLMGAAAGAAIVALNYIVIALLTVLYIWMGILRVGREPIDQLIYLSQAHHMQTLGAAGLTVNCWLLLFAVSLLAIQTTSYSLRAAKGVQWFLKQGQHHPLQAIGYVAAVIIFFMTLVGRLISWIA